MTNIIERVDPFSRHVDLYSSFSVPTQFPALMNDGNYQIRNVAYWDSPTPHTVNTSTKGEYIFTGKLDGTGNNTIYLSVIVGRETEQNPPSVFPDSVDEFIPKIDIETADIPSIDSYQYLKSKNPRHAGDDAALAQYRELLEAKMILAKDINHAQNCIVKIEEYLYEHPFTRYYKGLSNTGSGARVFKQENQYNDGKIGDLRTIEGGENISVEEGADSIVIHADVPPVPDLEEMINCMTDLEAGSFQPCGDINTSFHNEGIHWGGFNWRMVTMGGDNPSGFKTMLMQFGSGWDLSHRHGQGWIVKGNNAFIMEIKDAYAANRFKAMVIPVGGESGLTMGFHERDTSFIADQVQNPTAVLGSEYLTGRA